MCQEQYGLRALEVQNLFSNSVTIDWPLHIVIIGENTELKNALEALDHTVTMYPEIKLGIGIENNVLNCDLVICFIPFKPHFEQMVYNWWFPNGIDTREAKIFLLHMLKYKLDLKLISLFFEPIDYQRLSSQVEMATK